MPCANGIQNHTGAVRLQPHWTTPQGFRPWGSRCGQESGSMSLLQTPHDKQNPNVGQNSGTLHATQSLSTNLAGTGQNPSPFSKLRRIGTNLFLCMPSKPTTSLICNEALFIRPGPRGPVEPAPLTCREKGNAPSITAPCVRTPRRSVLGAVSVPVRDRNKCPSRQGYRLFQWECHWYRK